MIKKVLSLLFLLVASFAQAQAAEPEMADTLRESGKIYVVICVIAMIFLALVVFLVMLDRKLKKLEEKIK